MIKAVIKLGSVLLTVVWILTPRVWAQTTVKYVHTDVLGSVVAMTDASGLVVEAREYEPYGYQATPAIQDGPGYTGHLQDMATGLVYMQQRYYDPQIGRFLSVDPVVAYDNDDYRYFNRYAYAFNNPYRFTDPDGRAVQALWGAPIGAIVNIGV
ncbi:RHS repeat-associated core domain-containing protein [Pseudoxanthomonas suwonensis]|uniref:RHS repeat-associated core domain-containing protein n=1 Tax=Pseudoxanthomonas suwonensis TaxID=314722 RepID=UPI00069916F1|nr:RHS repeat-associated core domain-containing protein [Pseudoxanthomonas suwonensis]